METTSVVIRALEVLSLECLHAIESSHPAGRISGQFRTHHAELTIHATATQADRVQTKIRSMMFASMAIIAVCTCALARTCAAQAILLSDGGSFKLFNGQDTSAWTQIGNANWQIRREELVANQGVGMLLGRFPFADFDFQIDYWVAQGSQVSLFIHCTTPGVINRDTAYQVNLSDVPIDGYGAGSLVGALMAPPVATANQWNHLALKSRQDKLTIVLNGTVIADKLIAQRFPSGPMVISFAGGELSIKGISAIIPGRW